MLLSEATKGSQEQHYEMRQAMFLSYAFNENQNLCGSSDKDFHEFITPGSFVDIVIKQKEGPGEQATSLQIIPTTNALCIAYITQTWADGTHRGWMGDIGRGCHKEWYYSNMVVGDDYKPSQLQNPFSRRKAQLHG